MTTPRDSSAESVAASQPAAPVVRARDPYATPLWMQIAGPVLSVSAAIGTAYTRIGDEFYRKMKHGPGVSDLSAERYKHKNNLIRACLTNKKGGDALQKQLDALKAVYDQEMEGFIKKDFDAAALHESLDAIERQYTKGVKQILNRLGYKTEGFASIFPGIKQRFLNLGHETRFGILFSALIAGGASLGAFFILNQNNRLRHELRDIHARVDDTGMLERSTLADERDAANPTPATQVQTDGLQYAPRQRDDRAVEAPALAYGGR